MQKDHDKDQALISGIYLSVCLNQTSLTHQPTNLLTLVFADLQDKILDRDSKIKIFELEKGNHDQEIKKKNRRIEELERVCVLQEFAKRCFNTSARFRVHECMHLTLIYPQAKDEIENEKKLALQQSNDNRTQKVLNVKESQRLHDMNQKLTEEISQLTNELHAKTDYSDHVEEALMALAEKVRSKF